VENKHISSTQAKEFVGLVAAGKPLAKPAGMADQAGLSSVEAVCAQVVADHPDQMDLYRKGKTQVVNYMLGKAMQLLKGRADAVQVKAALVKAVERKV
jgi:aspartyl-tRNA(Asn)/glutamyl-tRNA(Gln) amidotransferase subunit B